MYPRIHTNQNGMILVLAMFMLALLSMIGIASMMTSTTDIEIATGERQYVETFYRAQASHIIACELLQIGKWDRGLLGFDTYDQNGDPVDFEQIDDYTFAFRVIDPDFYHNTDSVSKTLANGKRIQVWQVDAQDEDQLPCPDDISASECKALDAKIGLQDLDLWTDVRLVRLDKDGQQVTLADIDIDRVYSFQMAGGGAEFGSKDLGVGSLTAVSIYNVDARSRLSRGEYDKSPSRQALGLRIVN